VLERPLKNPSGLEGLYSGEVDAQGRPHGYGEWVTTEKHALQGSFYIGAFVDGYQEGIGKLVSLSGYTRIGNFVKGSLLDGVVLSEYSSGNCYSGMLKCAQRHGIGTLKLVDGRVYLGWFADDEFHGVGLCVLADGFKLAVTYERGLVVSETSGMMNVLCMQIYNHRNLDLLAVLQRENEMNGLFVHCFVVVVVVAVVLLM
jgi:hypothetical protein